MKKNYQTQTASARITSRTTPKKARIDPHRQAHEAALALPDTVTVAIGELAGGHATAGCAFGSRSPC